MQSLPLGLSALTNGGQTITCTSISPSSPAPSRMKFVFTPSRRALFCSLRRPQNETSSRMVIDTFFRSTAMIPPQKAIMMLKTQIPAVRPRLSRMDTVSGIVDYTAVVANSTIAGAFLSCSCATPCDTGRRELHSHPPTLNQRYGSEMIAFFAAEAKTSTIAIPLEGHLPKVLLELVACAKHLGYIAICTSSIPLTFCV